MDDYKPKDYQRSSNTGTGRNIPIGIKLGVLFGGATFLIGFIFLAMGLLFVFIFGSLADFSSMTFSDSTPTTSAIIKRITDGAGTVNDRPVLCYTYNYYVGNKKYTGYSYSETALLEIGDTVEVQYKKEEPVKSRIPGMRLSAFPAWVLLIILPFVLIGAGFSGYNIYKGIQNIKILSVGKTGLGKLLYKNPTGTRINNRTVYELTFEFKVGDKSYQAIAKSHTPEKLEDEHEEMLVYNPQFPEEAVMLDSLPRAVKKFFMKLNE
jgi:hypothetical protein